jgi:hypothetical protein
VECAEGGREQHGVAEVFELNRQNFQRRRHIFEG